jgi:2-polyprenyl-3-methyl-5-hydroxy-6-metoxy-1,4-benzoquinol methylase
MIEYNEIHSLNKRKNLQIEFSKAAKNAKKEKGNQKTTNYCLCCKSEKIINYGTFFEFDMHICLDCSLIFCNPMPSNNQLEKFYNSDYKKFENQFFIDTISGRRKIFKHRVEEIVYLKKKGKLLDIGSGVGIFIDELINNNANYEITACDLSLDACEKIKDRHGNIKVVNSSIQKLEAEKKYFDIITMWDCFEHLAEPDQILNKIHYILKDNGYVFLSTPNTSSLEWIIAGKKHVQLLPPGHVALYNIDNIKIIAKNNNFKIKNISTPNASLDFTYIKNNYPKIFDNNDIGKFLEYIIKDLSNIDMVNNFIEFVNKSKLAGNMLVVLEKEYR